MCKGLTGPEAWAVVLRPSLELGKEVRSLLSQQAQGPWLQMCRTGHPGEGEAHEIHGCPPKCRSQAMVWNTLEFGTGISR